MDAIVKTEINDIKRQKILMPFEVDKILKNIYFHESPRDLIHSLKEENFYFFIQNLDKEKVSYILPLASDSQWEYFFDMEIWNKDSLDHLLLTNLFNMMVELASDRFITWCFYQKIDLLELYFFKNLEINIITNPIEDQMLKEDSFTNDGVFYFNFIETDTLIQKKQNFLIKRNRILKKVLLKISNLDFFKYQKMLLEIIGIIPSELEEKLYMLRNLRLREKGLLPYHEAIGIYQPIKISMISVLSEKILKKRKSNNFNFYSYHFLLINMSRENFFIKVLKSIKNNLILEELLKEFSYLCNLIVIADGKKINGYKKLDEVVEKASNFINIGIQEIIQSKKKAQLNVSEINKILKKRTFVDLFRLGYSNLLRIKRKTVAWHNKSWFYNNKLKLYFWGDKRSKIIEKLLFDEPSFIKKIKNIYDFDNIERIINQVIEIDEMFSQFKIEFCILKKEFYLLLNFKNLLLTLWVLSKYDDFNKKIKFKPVSFKNFKNFYQELWYKKNEIFKIREVKKNEFIFFVSGLLNIKHVSLSKNLCLFFDDLFKEIEEELHSVSIKQLDPRYITLFIIEGH